jgi:hypothetical protein
MSGASNEGRNLKIKDLRRDGGTQPRVAFDQDVVREYAEAMKAGKMFPPVTVFFDGREYWLADGFHRVGGAIEAGRDTIAAIVIKGSQRDAVLFAVGANADHGMRRTNEDKRNAVRKLLIDKEWQQMPDAEIARKCSVSDTFVGGLRKELSSNGSKMTRTVVRNGKAYPMETKNIGKSKKPADTSPATERASSESTTKVVAEAPQEKPAAGTGVSALVSQNALTLDKPNGSQAGTAVHTEKPVQLSKNPASEDWPKWTWEPLTGETAVEAGSGALLVFIPKEMSVNEDLRALVALARKLKCAVFASPSIQELEAGVQK